MLVLFIERILRHQWETYGWRMGALTSSPKMAPCLQWIAQCAPTSRIPPSHRRTLRQLSPQWTSVAPEVANVQKVPKDQLLHRLSTLTTLVLHPSGRTEPGSRHRNRSPRCPQCPHQILPGWGRCQSWCQLRVNSDHWCRGTLAVSWHEILQWFSSCYQTIGFGCNLFMVAVQHCKQLPEVS